MKGRFKWSGERVASYFSSGNYLINNSSSLKLASYIVVFLLGRHSWTLASFLLLITV
jgi:hypothetical protein